MINQNLHPHLDRLIRIIYKELRLSEVLIIAENDSMGLTNKTRIKTEFDLSDKVFREKIRHRYFKVYPENYNYEEIDLVISYMCERIKEKYQSTNALFLIPIVSESIIHMQNKELYIQFEDLLEWDGYLNKLDSHAFVAAFLAQNQQTNTQDNLDLVLKHNNKILYNHLSQGISENHMHLKASGNITEMNWWHFKRMSLFAEEKIERFLKSNTFADISKEPESIRREREYIQKLKFVTLLVEEITLLGDQTEKENSAKFSWWEIQKILTATDTTTTLMSFADKISDLQNRLSAEISRCLTSTDFIEVERKILMNLFQRIFSSQKTDLEIYLFNLYLIGLNYIKFQFYQDNIGMGFAKFKEKEDNKSAFLPKNSATTDLIYEAVFEKYYREKRINKIEFRIGPEDHSKDYYTLIDKLDRINQKVYEKYRLLYRNDPSFKKIKYGLIVHYIKIKYKDDYATSNFLVCRDEQLRQNIADMSSGLLSYFEEITTVDRLLLNETYYGRIVAIDAANFEHQLRPEIFATLFRKHRQLVTADHNFYFTYHVGEDFSNLVNGLRAIDETIEFLNYDANDRLGHASALGIKVDDYFKKKRTIITSTTQDYLDDIIWMYQLISEHRSDKYELLIYLKSEYEAIIKEFYFSIIRRDSQLNFSLEDYIAAYYLRGDLPEYYLGARALDEESQVEYLNKQKRSLDRYYSKAEEGLNTRNCHHFEAFSNHFAHKLYAIYHYDRDFKKNGEKEIIKEATETYIQCVQEVQEILRQKIIDREVFVEANPSSNKKISSVTKYIDLPVLQLNRYLLEGSNELGNVPVTINTDDSALFQTNLSNEYSLVAAALIREGYAKETVMDYMEYLANASNVHSFIKD